MYQEHFGLHAEPFALSPKLDFVYRSRPFEKTVAHLRREMDAGAPVIVVSGPVGSGKTMALNAFLAGLEHHHVFALVTNTQLGLLELLKLVLEDLGQTVAPGMTLDEALDRVGQLGAAADHDEPAALIVIDEAQNLEPPVLRDLHRAVRTDSGQAGALQLVLAGQPELEDVLSDPLLEDLNADVGSRMTIAALDRAETGAYLRHRLAVAGGEPGLFPDATVACIHGASGGIPRVINTLAGAGLMSAFVAGRREVLPEDVADESGPATVTDGAAEPGTDAATQAETSAPVAPAEQVEPLPRNPSRAKAPAPTYARRARREGGPRRGLRAAAVAAVVVVAALAGLQVAGVLPLLPAAAPDDARSVGPQSSAPAPATAAPAASVTQDVPAADTPDTAPATAQEPAAQEPAAQEPAATVADAAAPGDPAQTETLGGTTYYIHISSFAEPERAQAEAARLSGSGQPSVVQESVIGGRPFSRVLLGPFAERDHALQRANGLLESGMISYYHIVRRDVAGRS